MVGVEIQLHTTNMLGIKREDVGQSFDINQDTCLFEQVVHMTLVFLNTKLDSPHITILPSL
jgi:hypothetical protein